MRSNEERSQESIVGNLERILNSHAEMSTACASFGIPELAQQLRMMPERCHEFAQSLARTVEEHEPRLTRIEVTHRAESGTPLTARFELRARLRAAPEPGELRWEAVIFASGRVKLR
jgi:type VI secretion system lysozyme-like protein